MSQRLLIGATAIAALLATPAIAAADDYRRGGPGYKKHRSYVKSHHRSSRYDGYRGRSHYRKNNDGDEVAFLIGGAILGYALNSAVNSGSRSSSYYSQPSYGYPQPAYNYGPPPNYGYAPPPTNYGYADPGYGYAPQPSYAGPSCEQVRGGRSATGAIIGGVVGGLVGNGVAASKNRGEGTAVGAVLGSVVGGSIGSSSAECGYSSPRGGYAAAPNGYSNAGYGGWRESGYLVPANAYPSGPAPASGYPNSGYGYDQNYNGGQNNGYGADDLYGGPTSSSQGCEISYRVTQYPDGREIREPIELCPDGRGGWTERY